MVNGFNILYSVLSKTPLNISMTIIGIILIFLLIYLKYREYKYKLTHPPPLS